MKRTSIGTAIGSVAVTCPTNVGSMGLMSRWRAICKTLSSRDRTVILRRSEVSVEEDSEETVEVAADDRLVSQG